jgi:serine protease Do
MTDIKNMQNALNLRSRRNQIAFALVATLAGVALVLLGTIGVLAETEATARGEETPAPPAAEQMTAPAGSGSAAGGSAAVEDQVALSRAFADVTSRVKPAVVNISTEQVVRVGETPFDDFFERFFGGPIPEQRRRSLGSGVIVDGGGHIITNNHVVSGAEEIDVQLSSGTTYEAEVVGTDPPTDLAVIRIEADETLPMSPLGDSDALEIGEWVLAIGNPFGFGQTVTAGIVSATARVIGQGPYDDFIQTDAAINPGNSGGPLVNLDGEVIGINSTIVSRTGGNMGIGFAIPSNMASNIYRQIIETGSVTRGWLGVSIQNLSPELAENFGLEAGEGALVSQVLGEDSPAGKAGLRAGDIIVGLDGEPIESISELTRLVADIPPGETVEVEFYRDGERRRADVTLARREETSEAAPGRQQDQDRGRLGISAQNLTPQLAAQLGTSSREGVLITEVRPESPAASAGLRRGDIIHEANRRPTATVEDLRGEIAEVPQGGTLVLRIERVAGGQGQYLYVPITLDEE